MVDPSLWYPSITAGFEVVEGRDKTNAAEIVDEIVSSGEICVFTDGSGYKGGIGASAVAIGRCGQHHVRRAYHGPDHRHLVFEGELAGMVMALNIIKSEPRVTRANILLDSRPAIRASKARRPRPGQQLVELFHIHYDRLKRKRRSLSAPAGHLGPWP